MLAKTAAYKIDKRLDFDGEHLKQLEEAIVDLMGNETISKTLKTAKIKLNTALGKIKDSGHNTISPMSNEKWSK